jgi:hypothetical protein
MSENKLVGSLILRTIDIDRTKNAPTTIVSTVPTPFENDYGLCTANGGVITWKNVNIRTCLGELYRKYDRFNLKMTAAQIRHNTVAAVTDAQFLVYISGLPFSSGSCYNTRLGPTSQSCIGAVDFTTTTAIGRTTSLLSGLVSFEKPLQDVINITVELKNSSTTTTNPLVNGYAEKTTMALGHWSIVCDIYGIE